MAKLDCLRPSKRKAALEANLAAIVEASLETSVQSAVQRAIGHFETNKVAYRRNVHFAMDRLTALDSGQFALDHMVTSAYFGHSRETLAHALNLAPKGGLALEFGVWSGTTLNIIAKNRGDQRVWGFDSFEGLPEDWRSQFLTGSFARNGDLPKVEGAELVIGWFDKTLPGFMETHAGPVDFVHIDCDLYSSTKTALEAVGPRLRPGSIVLFDEYFNYPGWREHEHKAWMEFTAKHDIKFKYEGYSFADEQVIVRVLETSNDTGQAMK